MKKVVALLILSMLYMSPMRLLTVLDCSMCIWENR